MTTTFDRSRSGLGLTILALLAMSVFAANSLLTRLALAGGAIDAPQFAFVRAASGAAMLFALILLRSRRSALTQAHSRGSWSSAFALSIYIVGFSLAYLRLGTGMGALILFTLVQATMIGWALRRGERPAAIEWAGIALAAAGFLWLVAPGLAAPDPLAATLMAGAGIGWGVYTLRGRTSTDPLGATAGNFIRATPLCLAFLFLALAVGAFDPYFTLHGYGYAAVCGAITSALGYTLWYRILPAFAATQASVLQLTVPVIAALMGLVFAGEPLTLRLVFASCLILGGVAAAIGRRGRSR